MGVNVIKFAIIPNLTRKNALDVTKQICKTFDKLEAEYVFPKEYEKNFSNINAKFLNEHEAIRNCDIVVTVGGDGTILHSAKEAAMLSKPVLGINAGRLAFMAGLETDEISMLTNLIDGNYRVDERIMLKTTVKHDGIVENCGYSINDTTVMRGGGLRICDLKVDLDGKMFNNYRGDGIIIATPTGSTAYSLSAGGPVLDPQLQGMILTPVCSHSLFSRPLIFKDDAHLGVKSADGMDIYISCDGEEPIRVSSNAKVIIEKADICAKFIRIKPDNFLDVLSYKFL